MASNPPAASVAQSGASANGAGSGGGPGGGSGRGKRSAWFGRLIAAAAIFFLVAAYALATVLFGQVAGMEFSPDKFHRRRFWYIQAPLFGFQVTGIYRDDVVGPVESHIQSQQLVPPPNAVDPEQWDLAYSYSGNRPVFHDAQILCTYLEMENSEGELVWLKWSEEHPELAKVLWKGVASLARDELYFFIPEAFDLARSAQKSPEFEKGLASCLARQYRQLAAAQQSLGKHDAAVAHYSRAIELEALPADKLSRAASYEALGEHEKGAADRQDAARKPPPARN